MNDDLCKICGLDHPPMLSAGFHKKTIDELRAYLVYQKTEIKRLKSHLRDLRKAMKK